MTPAEFFEQIVHTDIDMVPALRDHTAGEFLMKMATLKATVEFNFDRELCVTAKTPIGEYTFIFDSEDDDADLVVLQVA